MHSPDRRVESYPDIITQSSGRRYLCLIRLARDLSPTSLLPGMRNKIRLSVKEGRKYRVSLAEF